jgi:hypothetical protein
MTNTLLNRHDNEFVQLQGTPPNDAIESAAPKLHKTIVGDTIVLQNGQTKRSAVSASYAQQLPLNNANSTLATPKVAPQKSAHEREPKAGKSRLSRSLDKWVAIGLTMLMLGAFGGPLLRRMWNGIDPFAQKTVDHTGPTLLESITELHDYRAAEGTFNVVVDVEKDAKWLPAAIRGERVVLNAVGHVDAGVDFATLDAQAIVIDPKTNGVTITLPHAALRKAQLDLGASKVLQHKRGVLDRLGSAFGDAPATDRKIYQLAETKLDAAAQASDLVARAETNTRLMLSAFARGLGHSNVTIKFAVPGESVAPGTASPAARNA